MSELTNPGVFPQGELMPTAFRQYFSGQAYLEMLVQGDTEFNCPIGNVTFAPGCRNNWHRHPGGQILLVTAGHGWYQEDGQPARELKAGDVVQIAPQVRHWHGATRDSWLVHLSIETNSQAGLVQWLEPVSTAEYAALP